MKTTLKALTAALAGGLLLAGCAIGPSYGDPAYGYGYDPYGYNGPVYGPSVGFGYTYQERDHDGRWRDEHRRDGRDRAVHEGNWRDDRGPQGPGVDYNTDAERQNLENRERLLRGHEPSGAGG